jgi:hypothetical protein
MKRVLLILLLVLSMTSLAMAQNDETHEIFTVLDYSAEHFEPDLWRLSTAEETLDSSFVAWRLREQEDVLFFFVNFHFDAGVTDEVITDYFDTETFDALFVNYMPYIAGDECQLGDLRLYEFTHSGDGGKFVLRYWVEPISETRVMGVNGVAPSTHLKELDEYAERLFPDLPSCDALEQ